MKETTKPYVCKIEIKTVGKEYKVRIHIISEHVQFSTTISP